MVYCPNHFKQFYSLMNSPDHEFQPAPLLSHYHAQTLLASIGPRRFFVRQRARKMLADSRATILHCDDDVRLSGAYSASVNRDNKSLVILLHGWEGGIDSSYLLSAGARLYAEGHSIFRLNFRDHGDSQHLNKELFHSVRIKEIIDAVAIIAEKYPHHNICLAGFSLGGNFTLRIASRANQAGIQLDCASAICPLISPYRTTFDIEEGLWVYHHYFMRRWKKSLTKKMAIFPEYDYADALKASKRLSELNEYFVPNHTSFKSSKEYLDAYAINNDTLTTIDMRAHLLIANDDPIVQTRWFEELNQVENVDVTVTAYGGHCGFIKDWAFNSYADDWLIEKFAFAVLD